MFDHHRPLVGVLTRSRAPGEIRFDRKDGPKMPVGVNSNARGPYSGSSPRLAQSNLARINGAQGMSNWYPSSTCWKCSKDPKGPMSPN